MKRALAITISLLSAQTALAQKAPKPKPAKPAPAPAPSPPKPDVSALETSGNKHFELAEYDAAITDFKEAFRISDEPGFLYNIAQAYRLKRDCREAATFYKNFLRRVPDAPNAAKVRERIAEMDTCAATQPVTPVTTTTTTTTTPTTTATTTPIEPPPEVPEDPTPANDPVWMKWSGIAGIGVGIVGLGLAVKFGLDGKSANDELADKCRTSCSSDVALALENDGKAANRNMAIFGVAGGVVMTAGVVLLVLYARSGEPPKEKPLVQLSLTPESASAAYGWSF